MKSKPTKQAKQPIKLPSIGNKTMGDITKDTAKERQRPLSSKNIVNDLEKRLFSQLDSYDEKALTGKAQRGSSKVKGKANSTILASSCREINTKSIGIESDSMDKIAQCNHLYYAKVMPQLYSKIIQSKKYDDQKPLKETFSFTNEQPSRKQQTLQFFTYQSSTQIKKRGSQKSTLNESKVSSRIPSAKSTKQQKQKSKQKESKFPQNQKQPQNSFDFAQRQIDNIYQEYLKQEGLDLEPQTSVADLKEMNVSLSKCEVDIQELQRNYSCLIKQLGDICLNEME